jgi:molybdopterin converting factor small subunit
MFGAQFVTVAKKIQLKDGAGPKEAVYALYKSGAIDADVYKRLKNLKPPYFIVVNDQTCEAKPRTIRLKNGDSISVFQLMAGG